MTRLNRADPAPQPGADPSRERLQQEWKNVGPRAVHGLQPEEVGELYLTEGESQALVEAGYLIIPTEGEDDNSDHSVEETEEV